MSVREDVKFLQISDSHLFKNRGNKLIGVDTDASLSAVVTLACKEKNVAGVLATGDLSQDGSMESYQQFANSVQSLGAPVYWVPGNHDDPGYFHQPGKFPLSRRSIIEAGNWRILLLDSVVPGDESGHLSSSELDYIAKHVFDGERHTLLVMHHQPIPCGSSWLDSMILDNADDFLRLIEKKDSIRAVVNGHIHQARQQTVADILFISTPSTCFQFTPDTDEFSLDTRLPGYRRLILRHDGTIETEVVRLKSFELNLEPAGEGY
ncbi:MAG: 3',5'-cyclic-AMP phosphodiesterase [Pseudomonadota bacterium]|nr:3',5'-cyclic-AMP phosphodiesterase [Pseudomonadota bacterium]